MNDLLLQLGGPVDAVSLVVAALAVGVSTGLSDTVTSVVKDAYTSLRSLLSARFGSDVKAELVVAEHAQDPETYGKPMAKVIRESGAAEDPQVIAAARRLLELADPAGAAAGNYTVVNAQGSVIGIIGNQGTVNYTLPPIQPDAAR